MRSRFGVHFATNVLLCLSSFLPSAQVWATDPVTLECYVAPHVRPDQDGVGSLASPMTLQKALQASRSWKAAHKNQGPLSVRIVLRGGTYFLDKTLELDSEDSGTEATPFTWVAAPGEHPRLVGGLALPSEALKPVGADDPHWARLAAETRASLLVADLSPLRDKLYLKTAPLAYLDVFADGAPLTLARYPKAKAPEAVDLAQDKALRVMGEGLSPAVDGDYRPNPKVSSQGLRVYQMTAKDGDVWSIARAKTLPRWELSNRPDLGGKGGLQGFPLVRWFAWDGQTGPVGRFDQSLPAGKGQAWVEAADGSTPTNLGHLLTQGPVSKNAFGLPGDLFNRWPGAPPAGPNPMAFNGYGYYCWPFNRGSVAGLDRGASALELQREPFYGLRRGQPYFLDNLLEALTDPGEFYADKGAARLYLRPRTGQPPAETILPVLANAVRMRKAQFIRMEGITFEASRSDLVTVTEGQAITFAKCRFVNAGGYGLKLEGSDHRVDGCAFQDTGRGGRWLTGGDRKDLRPSNTLVSGCTIERYGRLERTGHPGIRIEQFEEDEGKKDVAKEPVGMRIEGNEIHHGPSAAILFRGNDHQFRGNHLHHVCQWTNDAGALYTHGRDLGSRGLVIRGNLIHHNGGPFGRFIAGIYLDSAQGGALIEHNLIFEPNGSFGVLLTGGRDVTVRDNLLGGSFFAIKLENTATALAAEGSKQGWDLLQKLQAVAYRSARWSAAYPELARLPDTWQELKAGRWLEPEGCSISDNRFWGLSQGVAAILDDSNCTPAGTHVSQFMKVDTNQVLDEPGFTDAPGGDFSLRAGSPLDNLAWIAGLPAGPIVR